MVKVEQKRVPLEGFEVEYENFVARKDKLEEELKAEFVRLFEEKSAKLNRLIDETSEVIEVEVEVPDEEVATEEVAVTNEGE